jgi:hypothetical protein
MATAQQVFDVATLQSVASFLTAAMRSMESASFIATDPAQRDRIYALKESITAEWVRTRSLLNGAMVDATTAPPAVVNSPAQ